MIQCPKCKGYGKTVSTRNLDNGVIRYHKCETCGETFTSTQRVDNTNINKDIIDDILKSKEFIFATSQLFQAFSLHIEYFYNNLDIKCYDKNSVILSSPIFIDGKENLDCRFDIELYILDNKAIGTIKLSKVLKVSGKYIPFTTAIVGTIKFDKEWTVNLDIPTINKLTQDKDNLDSYVEMESICHNRTTFEELDKLSNIERKNYLQWLRITRPDNLTELPKDTVKKSKEDKKSKEEKLEEFLKTLP